MADFLAKIGLDKLERALIYGVVIAIVLALLAGGLHADRNWLTFFVRWLRNVGRDKRVAVSVVRRTRCRPSVSKFAESSQRSKACASAGHSRSVVANHAVSRLRPLITHA